LRQSFDDKTKDFAALTAKLKADGIEVVVTTLNDFQVAALINDLVKIEYNKQITILVTDTLKTTDMIKETGKVGAFYATSMVLEGSEFAGRPQVFGNLPGDLQNPTRLRWSLHLQRHLYSGCCHPACQQRRPSQNHWGSAKDGRLCAGDWFHEVGRQRRATLRRGQYLQG